VDDLEYFPQRYVGVQEHGMTENAGPEIDGPKNNNILKMTDQIAGHEIDGSNQKP